MNANELAQELEVCSEFFEDRLYKKAATMLRQQQAEIEALKAEIVAIEKNTDYLADKGNWIQNNKPVAWMDSLGNLTKQNLGDFIPLYTHPVKELTDEEIWKIYNITGLGNGMALRFARAILRKAQEK